MPHPRRIGLTLLAAAILTGIGNGFGSGIMMTLGADLAPKGSIGEFLGLWRLIGDIGSTGGPLVVKVASLPKFVPTLFEATRRKW